MGAQLFPYRRVAKEIGDPDQQFLEQQVELLRVVAQVTDILRNAFFLMQRAPALDSPVQRIAFVEREIGSAAIAQQNHHLVERALCTRRRSGTPRPAVGIVAHIGSDALWHLRRRRNDVGQACGDRAARHAGRFCRVRCLRQGESGLLLDGAQSEHAVRAHPRQDHANGLVAPVVGQRAQKKIDRQAQPARRRWLQQIEPAVEQRQIPVGRNDVKPGLVRPACGRSLQRPPSP